MRKHAVLMRTQSMTTFYTLNFNNFLFKHSVSMKRLLVLSTANNWESNTFYRTCIAYTEGEIRVIKVM